ncbi:NifZ family protein [[Clostridium] ultunense Esp]|nr:NifZ family protein [[Clostridium] ultunense Esp]
MLGKFDLEDIVRTTKKIRNDGTYPGMDRGAIIIREGEVGTIVDYGYFLQDILVYTVFFARGLLVGCLENELELVERGNRK